MCDCETFIRVKACVQIYYCVIGGRSSCATGAETRREFYLRKRHTRNLWAVSKPHAVYYILNALRLVLQISRVTTVSTHAVFTDTFGRSAASPMTKYF